MSDPGATELRIICKMLKLTGNMQEWHEAKAYLAGHHPDYHIGAWALEDAEKSK